MSDFEYSKDLINKLKLFETQFAEYESPIQIVMGEWQTSVEDNCVKAIQSYGFNINKEELGKALQYDRHQYDKGYEDARRRFERPDRWGKWVVSEIQCPNCLEYFQTDCYSKEELNKCPICGAEMRGEGNENKT